MKQIKAEFVNLLKTKFILIIGIIVFIMGFVGPIINAAVEKYSENNDYGTAIINVAYSYSMGSGTSITIDGVEISTDNPFYYDVYYYSEEYAMYLDASMDAEQRKIVDEIAQLQLETYLKYAQEVTTYEDYRMDLVRYVADKMLEVYVLEAQPVNEENFMNGIMAISYVDKMDELLALSEEEKLVLIEEKKEFIESADQALTENDFDSYVDCMIVVLQAEIATYEESIAIQEAAVIENPDLEESAEAEIERLQDQITTIEENTIPTWEYRKEQQIYPNSDDWRNSALNEIEYATYRLNESMNIVKEEEFSSDLYLQQTYTTYANYLKAMESQKLDAQTDILIAQNSLEANEPDMKFAGSEARSRVNANLSYALTVSVLGILIGGYLIANEFQTGTIRLLMIRPRTRTKVYGAKYIAGLLYIYAIYLAGMLCNIIANGVTLGFSDYGYPNYTASGEVNFWGMILGRILICSVTMIFSYTVAFALSSLIKNAAISIALPSAGIFGGMLVATMFSYSKFAKYLAYTPLPYLNFASFYSEYGIMSNYANMGVNLQVPVGVVMLLVIAIAFYIFGLFMFKKHDITN